MYYVSQSETGREIYSLSPLWGKLRESYACNAGIDNNGIVLEKSFEKAKHRVNLHRYDKDVCHGETRYPRLDRLIEEHF
jgi:hypothetical protein